MRLIQLFLSICLFQKGPQDVPASGFLFGLTFLIYWVIATIIVAITSDWWMGIIQALVEIAIALALVWGVLLLSQKQTRFQQTATALLGSDALISLAALPVLASVSVERQDALPYFLLLGFMLWSVAVTGHILRHALAKPLYFGIGVAILYFFVSYQVLAYWFPAPG